MLSKCSVLALETATDFIGVGVMRNNIPHEFIIQTREGEKVLVFIDHALKKVNLELKDIELLTVGIGPGLYTGVRIGLSIMKGLSMAIKKPLLGISTLDTMSYNFLGNKEKIVTLLNAYGGEVYGAIYEVETGLKRLGNYFVGPIEDFLKKINSQVIFAGAGLKIYQKKIENILGDMAIFAREENWIPRPGSLAKLAIKRFKKPLPNPDKILPLYLKKPEAERKWKISHSHP